MVSTPTPDSAGGGAASARFVANPSAITTAGHELGRRADDLMSCGRGDPVPGSAAGAVVEQAVGEFRRAWDEALRSWQRDLGLFGAAATQSADAIDADDRMRAMTWTSIAGSRP